jgi:hypothetical protein
MGQRQWNRSGQLLYQSVLTGVQALEVGMVQADGLTGTHGRIQLNLFIFCGRAIFRL